MKSKKAFEKFYQTHLDKVYRFVFFRIVDKEQAQDLVSEIFMKALEHFEDYDEQKSGSAWIMTIAKNHLANFWRDRKPTQSLEIENKEGEEEENEILWVKSSLAKWQKEQNSSEVYELLAKISEEDAEIVTLHYLHGYNYNEIAQFKGKNETAIKVAAHRALKKLRDLL